MIEEIVMYVSLGITALVVIGILKTGLKTIEPTEVGAKETFGKYGSFMEWVHKIPQDKIKNGYKTSGLNFVFPFVQKLRIVNTTEKLVNVEKQDVITKENLNCKVDAQVYYKIKRDEESMVKALYSVDDVDYQIVELAQSTLRAVIGQKMFKEVNASRKELNKAIFGEIESKIGSWGIALLKVELKELFPPPDVQQTMNEIIKAENEKDKQSDLKQAKITAAEADKQEAILQAEAKKQSNILNAQGEKETQKLKAEGEKEKIVLQAQAEKERQELVANGQASAIVMVADANKHKIEVENKALTDHFTGSAIVYKNLETIEKAYRDNSKIIVTDKDHPLTFILDETQDGKKIIPIESHKPENVKENKVMT